MQFALGSASELQYEVLLAHDLGFMEDEQHDWLSASRSEVKQMLTVFLQKLMADS